MSDEDQKIAVHHERDIVPSAGTPGKNDPVAARLKRVLAGEEYSRMCSDRISYIGAIAPTSGLVITFGGDHFFVPDADIRRALRGESGSVVIVPQVDRSRLPPR